MSSQGGKLAVGPWGGIPVCGNCWNQLTVAEFERLQPYCNRAECIVMGLGG